MKKVFILSFSFIYFISVSKSQTIFGAKIGTSHSTISEQITPFFASGIGTSFTAGIFLESRVKNRIGIQYGLNYYSSNYGGLYSNKSYLMFPVNFKFYAGNKFSFDVAPLLSVMTSSPTILPGRNSPKTNVIDIKPSFGFSLDISENMIFETKYLLSVSQYNKLSSYKNYFQSFNFTLGFKFRGRNSSKSRIETLIPLNN
jgi:hypothetical protein